MAIRRARQMVLLAGAEASYMAATSLTPAANACLVRDFKQQWMLPVFTTDKRVYSLSDGDQGAQMGSQFYAITEYEVEAIGTGNPGEAPPYRELIRACGMKETVVPTVSVTYTPDTLSTRSIKMITHHGGVQYTQAGARGTFAIRFKPGEVPTFRFKFWGWCSANAVDAATPTPTLSGWKRGLIADDVNTVTTLASATLPHHEIDFDLGNDVQLYTPFNGSEINIADRKAKARVKLQSTSVAERDWDAYLRGRTRFNLNAVHGTVAGYKVKVALPYCELDPREAMDEEQGILASTFALRGCINAGDDDFQITFT